MQILSKTVDNFYPDRPKVSNILSEFESDCGEFKRKLNAASVRSTLLHHQELRSDQKMPADSINYRTAPPGEEPPGGNKQGSADSPECSLRLISLSGGGYTQNLWTTLWKTKKKLSRMQFWAGVTPLSSITWIFVFIRKIKYLYNTNCYNHIIIIHCAYFIQNGG